ncbi:ATPase [Oceanobacillus picturae]|uniref:ATPase n=1 Tax=Oceanobacillus picturae TaxID=171693 RepID=A0A0U9HEB6_9BACI|nr:ATPase [Oceanobacillus picturae]
MNNISTTTLTMKREFNVKPERVFEAWLNPDEKVVFYIRRDE